MSQDCFWWMSGSRGMVKGKMVPVAGCERLVRLERRKLLACV